MKNQIVQKNYSMLKNIVQRYGVIQDVQIWAHCFKVFSIEEMLDIFVLTTQDLLKIVMKMSAKLELSEQQFELIQQWFLREIERSVEGDPELWSAYVTFVIFNEKQFPTSLMTEREVVFSDHYFSEESFFQHIVRFLSQSQEMQLLCEKIRKAVLAKNHLEQYESTLIDAFRRWMNSCAEFPSMMGPSFRVVEEFEKLMTTSSQKVRFFYELIDYFENKCSYFNIDVDIVKEITQKVTESLRITFLEPSAQQPILRREDVESVVILIEWVDQKVRDSYEILSGQSSRSFTDVELSAISRKLLEINPNLFEEYDQGWLRRIQQLDFKENFNTRQTDSLLRKRKNDPEMSESESDDHRKNRRKLSE